ncbi:hypothetical protein PQQ73_21655 [Paraburkholderia strydomiana]|uniref:Uncharacterized protein n=1 Tax=Paraburkholderia strydomiana TaxID=1245417 RepID=A0ABW9EIP7_9BURK
MLNEFSCADSIAQSLITWVAAIKLGLSPQDSIASRFDDMKLEALVLALFDMDVSEAAQMDVLSDSETPFKRCQESFFETLKQVIGQLRLFRLFACTRDGEHHRSIVPAAYDEWTGEHHPKEMACWRADFRAMRPDQQMMTATIIWLYRSGSDSIWLRRVPCTWKASEALHYMHDAGCLAQWLQLIARYPGW